MSERSFRRAGSRRQARAARRARHAGAAVAAAGIAAALLPGVASADDTITVTNKNDTGSGSFRAAVTAANSTPDHDTIVFASNVTGSIDLLSEVGINYSTTIDGPGASQLELYGNGSRALFFYAFGPATLTVEGVTISSKPYSYSAVGPAITGNCIGYDAPMVLRDVEIKNSRSFNSGGAIFSDGCDLSLERTKLTGNVTQDAPSSTGSLDGGAIAMIDSPGGGTADVLSIVNSELRNNRASASGGGAGGAIAIGGASPDVTIRTSTIAGNSAGGKGGGLYIENADDVTIERSTIADNTSSGTGGGVYFGYGDAFTVDSSTINGNRTVARGGGIFSYANEEPFIVRNSTIADNGGARGGGIYSLNYYDQPVTIANSTIVGNLGDGVARNGADNGSPGPDELTISSSIIAGSIGTNDISAVSPSGAGAFRVDHSIIGATSGPTGSPAIVETVAGSNQLGVGAVPLGPLADNGGPTRTMLPPATSPAIDAGVANGLATDQRGQARTVDAATPNGAGDGTDVGAAEQTDFALVGGTVGAKSVQKQRGKKVAVVVEVSSQEPAHVDATGEVSLGKKSLPLGATGSDLAAGQSVSLRLTATSRRAKRKILAALGKGKRVKASIDVTLTDAAGNSDTETTSVRLKAKKKRKK